MTENEILNIFLSITKNTYPQVYWWYSSVYSSPFTKYFICEICNDDKEFFTIDELENHGRSHLEEATRTLKLKEFL